MDEYPNRLIFSPSDSGSASFLFSSMTMPSLSSSCAISRLACSASSGVRESDWISVFFAPGKRVFKFAAIKALMAEKNTPQAMFAINVITATIAITITAVRPFAGRLCCLFSILNPPVHLPAPRSGPPRLPESLSFLVHNSITDFPLQHTFCIICRFWSIICNLTGNFQIFHVHFTQCSPGAACAPCQKHQKAACLPQAAFRG